jgi:hypothetical protein
MNCGLVANRLEKTSPPHNFTGAGSARQSCVILLLTLKIALARIGGGQQI